MLAVFLTVMIKILGKSNLREEDLTLAYSSAAYNGRASTVIAQGSWSYGIHDQEAERDEC